MPALPSTTRTPQAPTSGLRRGFAVAAAAGLLAAFAGQLPAAAAPGDQSAGTTTANVGVNSSITLQGLTPSFTLNGLPGATVAQVGAVAYNVLTNNVGGYTVSVTAADDVLTPAGTSTDTIPIGNLAVRAGGDGAYTALSADNAVNLREKDTRSASDGDDYADDYRVNIPFVADDVYSVTLNYVAVAS